MICLTSFSSKAAGLLLLLLVLGQWGCGGSTAEISPDPKGSADREKDLRVMLITVLPVENLSGTSAPLKEIGNVITRQLQDRGYNLLDDTALEQFRKRHRMRYIGGVGTQISQVLQEETGVEAILITSLESYNERNPPQISLISRLVTSGGQPEIIWIDSIGLSGDQSPGLLGIGRITEPGPLLEKAAGQLIGSMAAFLAERASGDSPVSPAADWNTEPVWQRKYLPYDYFRSPIFVPGRNYSIAVIPMLNLAVRKNAGAIASLHYVRELHRIPFFHVIEPGVVREELLRVRAIMPAGPSLAVADIITSQQSLGVDLVLSGKAFDYQDTAVNPKVDFSMQVIERQSREVIFNARTFATGDKGVVLFDIGRVFTAHNLLKELSATTVQLLTSISPPPEIEEKPIALETDRDRSGPFAGNMAGQKKRTPEYNLTFAVPNETRDSSTL